MDGWGGRGACDRHNVVGGADDRQPVAINIVLTLGHSLNIPLTVTSQPFSVTTLDHFLIPGFSGSFNYDIAAPPGFVVIVAEALPLIHCRFSRPV
ncbi:MAG: hypothetical protein EVA87_14595 [Rhodospirillaceae bacterium]|nr:MAG: hypothetical protein EVA87_14595 [Rhodospirillaceae bacterium]